MQHFSSPIVEQDALARRASLARRLAAAGLPPALRERFRALAEAWDAEAAGEAPAAKE